MVLGLAWLGQGLVFPALGMAAMGAAALVPDPSRALRERRDLARFWERVAILTSAGLPLMQAVEEALPDGELGADIGALVQGLAWGDAGRADRFRKRYPSPEGEMVVTSLQSGWVHGLEAEGAFEQAQEAHAQLDQILRARLTSTPLWSTLIPAALLLALMAVILVPLAAAFVNGFGHL
jgi:hypothetical protein